MPQKCLWAWWPSWKAETGNWQGELVDKSSSYLSALELIERPCLSAGCGRVVKKAEA